MYLNDLQPAEGSTHAPKRRGRGIGSGLGKTGGVGVKGQKSRGKGKVRTGFEGGQMPLYRRLPKFGFTSLKQQVTAEVRLSEIAHVEGEITLDSLKAANIVRKDMVRARIILSGEVARAVTVKGVAVTKGARAAIEAAGGKVEE
ncbi:50S ribosomal protein L15 [Perlucidibaca aquatica]|jgi:large subunit ribosomal protein L15|uniref:50S ribosomal protein L15 n=1 Tax=Perlucidibaca aquatica TaxID=1852776 RepID=UPI00083B1BD7|nr:50S ribosomal protein L15 [Perlucidibaca aquatica]